MAAMEEYELKIAFSDTVQDLMRGRIDLPKAAPLLRTFLAQLMTLYRLQRELVLIRGYLRQMEASTLIEASARALGHPVSIVLAEDGHDLVACSLGGDPLRMRAAWLDPAGQRVIAKVGCPPLRPSRARPVVACSVGRFEPEIPPDRLGAFGAQALSPSSN